MEHKEFIKIWGDLPNKNKEWIKAKANWEKISLWSVVESYGTENIL